MPTSSKISILSEGAFATHRIIRSPKLGERPTKSTKLFPHCFHSFALRCSIFTSVSVGF